MILSIVDFLNARIEEDEAAAQAATPGPWHDDGGCISSAHYQITDYGAYTKADGEPEEWEPQQQRADSAHIARHDPARVLREVATKRAIIEEHAPKTTTWIDEPDTLSCGRCGKWNEYPVAHPCRTLRNLASIYEGHPDYREEWRP